MVLRQIPVSVTMGELGCPGQGRGRVGVGGLPLWDSRELTFSNDMRGGASNLKKRIMKVSHSVISDSLSAHGLSMDFSRPEYWRG